MSEAEFVLEPAIADAIAAARAWNQEHPDERLPRARIDDVYRAFGPRPVFVAGAEAERIVAQRPDLAPHASWGRIALPEAGAPPERAMQYPICAVEYPGLLRAVDLAQRAAIVALPVWLTVHRDRNLVDNRPVTLLADLSGAAVSGLCGAAALRDQLAAECNGKHPPPAEAALRTIVLAHDLATQSEKCVETETLEDLLFRAWEEASPKQTGVAAGKTPLERRRKLLTWWLTFAAPSAGARMPVAIDLGAVAHDHDHDHDH